MSEISCSDVCEVVLDALHSLGFEISDDPDHTDVLNALEKVKFVRTPALVIDRQVIEEFFDGMDGKPELTEEFLKKFIDYLDLDVTEWLKDNWHSFRGN